MPIDFFAHVFSTLLAYRTAYILHEQQLKQKQRGAHFFRKSLAQSCSSFGGGIVSPCLRQLDRSHVWVQRWEHREGAAPISFTLLK